MEGFKVININRDVEAEEKSKELAEKLAEKGRLVTLASKYSLHRLEGEMKAEGYSLEKYYSVLLHNSVIRDGQILMTGAHEFLTFFVNNEDRDDCRTYLVKGEDAYLLGDSEKLDHDSNYEVFMKLVQIATDSEEMSMEEACARSGAHNGKPKKPEEIRRY